MKPRNLGWLFACLFGLGLAACESIVVVPEPGTIELPETTTLIISEWACSSTADADGFRNTYLEIYNGTGVAIDLSDYGLLYRRNSNSFGEDPGDSLVLSGMIEQGEALVIGRPELDASKVGSDFSWPALTANGDDAVVLCTIDGANNYTILDYLGDENRPSTPGYSVAGETNATRDRVLQRKFTVMDPATDWDSSRGANADDSEWIVLDKEAYFNAGKATPKP